MKYKTAYFFILLLFSIQLIGCKENNNQNSTLRIATAANMQFVVAEMITAFQNNNKIPCELIIGSSGKLTAQILSGAPYDLFVSADMFYPNKIKENGMNASEAYHYANGEIVIWSMKKQPLYKNLDSLIYKKIAIANPKTAPYGKAAFEMIQYLYGNEIESKLVYGESISQVNQFIISEAVDIGITSNFIVNAPSQKKRGKWQKISPSTYTPIQQGMIAIKGKNANLANQFIQFVKSKKGQNILDSYSASK